MGDETSQFASLFSDAVRILADFASGERGGRGGRAAGPRGEERTAALRRALDAIEAVYATETSAVRDWADERQRVLAAVARVRTALGGPPGSDALALAARDLVALVEGSHRDESAADRKRRPRR